MVIKKPRRQYVDKDGVTTTRPAFPRCEIYGKFKYPTRKAGLNALNNHACEGSTIYKCDKCRCYHITSQEVKAERKAEQRELMRKYEEAYEKFNRRRVDRMPG